MVAIFKQGVKVPYFLSLREIFIFHGLLLFSQHRNIRQVKGTLICSYTNSQSHASIFLIPAHKFSAIKNTYIYLHQKRPREANSGF